MDVLNTKTVPEPEKTVDDLWLDARVFGQYGSLMERMRYGLPLEVEPQLPDNDANALDYFLFHIPVRPRPDQFSVPGWFRRSSLGQGEGDNYWDNQIKLEHRNAKANKELERKKQELERARKARVLSRKRFT